MNQPQQTTDDNAPTFKDEEGTAYPEGLYHPTKKAVGTQQEVANWWAEMKVPVHENGILRSGTGNFKGYQYPDGHGKLKHYRHLEAIRTKEEAGLLVISDTECYARGWAHCSTPAKSHIDGYAPLTSIKSDLRGTGVSIYDINRIEGVEVDTPDGKKTGTLIGFHDHRMMMIVAGQDKSYRSTTFDQHEVDQKEVILKHL